MIEKTRSIETIVLCVKNKTTYVRLVNHTASATMALNSPALPAFSAWATASTLRNGGSTGSTRMVPCAWLPVLPSSVRTWLTCQCGGDVFVKLSSRENRVSLLAGAAGHSLNSGLPQLLSECKIMRLWRITTTTEDFDDSLGTLMVNSLACKIFLIAVITLRHLRI